MKGTLRGHALLSTTKNQRLYERIKRRCILFVGFFALKKSDSFESFVQKNSPSFKKIALILIEREILFLSIKRFKNH